jgi:hypothetical protein
MLDLTVPADYFTKMDLAYHTMHFESLSAHALAPFDDTLTTRLGVMTGLYFSIIKGDAPIYFVLRRTGRLWENTYPIHALHYCFLGPSLPQSIETDRCPRGSVKFETILLR